MKENESNEEIIAIINRKIWRNEIIWNNDNE